MDTSISIVIPVYNIQKEYLQSCADSILRQTDSHWEVIFIDDGSPDQCGALCDEIAAQDARIRVIHQENQGVSVARNVGIENACYDWVAFVDPDDWMEPVWIERLREAVQKDNSYDIICFDYWREFTQESRLESMTNQSVPCTGELLNDLRNAPFDKFFRSGKEVKYACVAIWNKLYKKSFLNDRQLRYIPAARKAQDRLFNARALQSTDRIYYLHEPFYHYRCNSESVTNRFNPDIVELTTIQLKELQQIITQFHMGELTREYLNARICTRLYSCMRLYYFHPQNQSSSSQQIAEVREQIRTEPFASALRSVHTNLLSKKEKLFVYCLKLHWLRLCRMLVRKRAKNFSQQLQ